MSGHRPPLAGCMERHRDHVHGVFRRACDRTPRAAALSWPVLRKPQAVSRQRQGCLGHILSLPPCALPGRSALPLFHGLFCESLKLFPGSGKAAWATYFPFHLVLYLAAAHTFGGKRQELDSSAFLDHLGEALLASFEVPNSQELQRGLRTREHRFLTAFLCRFHPTPGIESIYRAFVERETLAAGQVAYGIFDLLYAPTASGPIASFPDRPLLAKDVGDIIATVRGEHTMGVSISGGPKAGRSAAFHPTS